MRSSGRQERGVAAVDDSADGRPRLLRMLGWSRRDTVAFVVAVVASLFILVNVLFRQAGPHPAPMIKSSIIAVVQGPVLAGTTTTVPQPRPSVPSPKAETAKAAPAAPTTTAAPTSTASTPTVPAAAARANAAVVADIQRELARRGFYDGAVDGKYGPRTDAAIRDFEHAAGLRPSGEPNDALLRAIKSSPIRARPAVRAQATPPARPDPISAFLTPSSQVIAVQRALSEFGYGQIRPSGVIDSETQSAIQKFERERRLPVTGQLSHRVVRELAAITGRPLE